MKYTQQEIDFIKKYYISDGPLYCAQHLNRSRNSITHKANSLGIRIITNKQINTKIFTEQYTPESSYILGLLWADGNIAHNSIRLECIKSDIDIFAPTFMKTGEWNISYRSRPNRQPQASLYISNKLITDFLKERHYTSHNTKSAQPILDEIPEHLHHYWCRGLSDGDGCWYINIKNGLYRHITAASYHQDWSFLENIYNKLNIKYSVTRRTNGKNKYSAIRITNKLDTLTFGQYIYQHFPSDNIGLPRKYNKYLEIKSRL